ncbi:centromere protein U [Ornithorhynchus anatinus]|uniref:centromere protein U n=1 Tax=Ornithorhynchus anatinus TaxID=9258 RepID=UPI0010A76DA1|nr:centromere protein U [Ornithorhynchus anatinus]
MPRRGDSTKKTSKKKLGRDHQSGRGELPKKAAHPRNFLSPEEPDLSRILKANELDLEEDEPDHSFAHPLHSTAVYTDEEDTFLDPRPLAGSPPPASTPLPKGAPRLRASRIEFEAEDRPEDRPARKAEPRSGEAKPASTGPSDPSTSAKVTNLVKRFKGPQDGRTPSASNPPERSEAPPAAPPSQKGPRPGPPRPAGGREILKRRERCQGEKRKKLEAGALTPAGESEDGEPAQGPDGVRRPPRGLTDLRVILSAFEDAVTMYKQEVESKICKKAIDSFYADFKEQLTQMVTDAQDLTNLKRRNAKVVADINQKRKRLLEVREELIRTQPQLSRLRREHAELSQRKASLARAADFLADLKQLRHRCLDFRERNPAQKETYGPSSLPALLVESRSVLKAENHLQNINRRLKRLTDRDEADAVEYVAA